MASGALLGVDVVFAETRRSTGLAWLADGKIETALTGTSWDERSRDLPYGVRFSIAALDAPVLASHDNVLARGCEAVFYRGAFARRCKPGLSHHGRGLLLRSAGTQAATDFAAVLGDTRLPFGPHAIERAPIIEAFPNTFMGVLLPEETFTNWSNEPGKAKSDWLYEQVAEAGIFRKLLSGLDPAFLAKQFEASRHHDERAALVCLLTAAFAFTRQAVIVGDPRGGWFWLPPIRYWDPWATAALEQNLSQKLRQRFPDIDRWSDGRPGQASQR